MYMSSYSCAVASTNINILLFAVQCCGGNCHQGRLALFAYTALAAAWALHALRSTLAALSTHSSASLLEALSARTPAEALIAEQESLQVLFRSAEILIAAQLVLSAWGMVAVAGVLSMSCYARMRTAANCRQTLHED